MNKPKTKGNFISFLLHGLCLQGQRPRLRQTRKKEKERKKDTLTLPTYPRYSEDHWSAEVELGEQG